MRFPLFNDLIFGVAGVNLASFIHAKHRICAIMIIIKIHKRSTIMKLGPCLLLDEPSSSLVRFTFDEQGFSWEQAAENPEMRGGYGQFKEMPSGSRDWLVASTDTPNQVEYYHFDEKTQRLSHVFGITKNSGQEEKSMLMQVQNINGKI